MGKQEFIDQLRKALNSSLSPALAADHVNYYEDYINTEIRKGHREEDVLASLGDPRLIARTIIETNTTDDGTKSDRRESYQDAGYSQGSYSFRRENYGNAHQNPRSTQWRIPGWAVGVMVILAIVVVLSLVLSVLSFLAPVLVPLILVLFLVKLFRDWLN